MGRAPTGRGWGAEVGGPVPEPWNAVGEGGAAASRADVPGQALGLPAVSGGRNVFPLAVLPEPRFGVAPGWQEMG